MNQEQRTEELRKIMADHRLKAPAVGKILNRSSQTVRSWACKNRGRSIPETALRLLKLTVAGGVK